MTPDEFSDKWYRFLHIDTLNVLGIEFINDLNKVYYTGVWDGAHDSRLLEKAIKECVND